MGVFSEEGVDQARKRAARDGKREPEHFTQRRKEDFAASADFAALRETIFGVDPKES
jgi:hypothetical protein